jgi:hypothetical protein
MKMNRIWSGLVAGAMVAGTAVVARVDPSTSSLFPICPLYAATSVACPGCGLTRAYHALFNGDIAAAFGFNALFPFVGLLLAYVFLTMATNAVRGKGLDFPAFGPKTTWLAFAAIILFGVARNIPAYPFTMLYP